MHRITQSCIYPQKFFFRPPLCPPPFPTSSHFRRVVSCLEGGRWKPVTVPQQQPAAAVWGWPGCGDVETPPRAEWPFLTATHLATTLSPCLMLSQKAAAPGWPTGRPSARRFAVWLEFCPVGCWAAAASWIGESLATRSTIYIVCKCVNFFVLQAVSTVLLLYTVVGHGFCYCTLLVVMIFGTVHCVGVLLLHTVVGQFFYRTLFSFFLPYTVVGHGFCCCTLIVGHVTVYCMQAVPTVAVRCTVCRSCLPCFCTRFEDLSPISQRWYNPSLVYHREVSLA